MDRRSQTSKSSCQLSPSTVTFPDTDKQLFSMKPFHLPFKAVSRSPTPGSPPWVPLLLESPKSVPLDNAETQRYQQPPALRLQKLGSNRIKEIKSSMYGKISAGGGQGSPDQVEGQPVYDEGLEGCSAQSQVELEMLPGSWAPHAVGAQGCCPQRAHLEERRAEAEPSWGSGSSLAPTQGEGGRGSPDSR